jgi:hypothetical protein
LLDGPVSLVAGDQKIWAGTTRYLRRCAILFFESRVKIRQDVDGPLGREVTTGGEEGGTIFTVPPERQ